MKRLCSPLFLAAVVALAPLVARAESATAPKSVIHVVTVAYLRGSAMTSAVMSYDAIAVLVGMHVVPALGVDPFPAACGNQRRQGASSGR